MTGFIDFNDASRSYYTKLESLEKAESSDMEYAYDLNNLYTELAEVVIKHAKAMRNDGVYDKATRKEFAKLAIEGIREALYDMSEWYTTSDVIEGDEFLEETTVRHMIEDL